MNPGLLHQWHKRLRADLVCLVERGKGLVVFLLPRQDDGLGLVVRRLLRIQFDGLVQIGQGRVHFPHLGEQASPGNDRAGVVGKHVYGLAEIGQLLFRFFL